MATARQNGFDGRKLADLIALLDSPVDAEAAGAVHRIRVLKKKHGDVPFYELVEWPDYNAAIWEKFGNPECLKAQMEAAALVEKLRQDNAQLEKDGAALALAVKRQEQIISELRQQITAGTGSAKPQARVRAFNVGEEFFDGLFALVVVWSGAALLFAFACYVLKAVFGH